MDNFDDAEHGLGGIPAFDSAEATDENPDRVTAARALLRGAYAPELCPQEPDWYRATAVRASAPTAPGPAL
ncbi:hypothetical protein ACFY8O_29280 [Streptomyces argenteolus]|uniref:Uncharacterized protein n=1 Tax=Streptomyces argenteolus TaxID=67274 RepID=A0ABW6XE19_9ACTN